MEEPKVKTCVRPKVISSLWTLLRHQTQTHTHTHTPHSTSKTNKKNNLTRSSYDNVKTKENYGSRTQELGRA